MAITRPQLHDAIVQTKEYIDKNVSELQDKIYSRGGYVIVDSLPVQNVQMDKTYLVPKVDSNGYAISGSYLEYVYAVRYNSGTTITDGLIDLLYDKFIKMLPNSGTYAFVYDNDIWKYNDETIVLYDYGITILDGTPVQDDTITISVSNGSWEPLGDATLDLSGFYNKTEIDAKDTALNTAVSGKEPIFRYTTMPVPHAGIANKIVQYVGTSGTFTQPNFSIDVTTGYYYKAVLDPDNSVVTIPNQTNSNQSNSYSFPQEMTITLNAKRGYAYIDEVAVITPRPDGNAEDRTFVLPANSILRFWSNVVGYAMTNIKATGTLYKWIPQNVQPQPSSINSINDINDVEITDAQDGQAIVYDEENDKWINKVVQGSSNIIDDTIATANKTWSSHKISEAIGAIQNTINNNNDSIETTLIAANWDSNGEQTITFDYLPDDIDGVIGIPISASVTQKEEFANCVISVIAQDINELTFKAVTKPTIDLPIMIYTGAESYVEARTNYSTTEKVIGTWIDGKPIYQKTIDCGSLPNTTIKTIAHNISNIDSFVKIEGIAQNGSNGAPIPFTAIVQTDQLAVYVNATNISIVSGKDRSSYNAYITLQYTKTTD